MKTTLLHRRRTNLGMGLLGIILVLGASFAVIGGLYTAYRYNERATQVADGSHMAQELARLVQTDYQSSGDFKNLSAEALVHSGSVPDNLKKGNRIQDVWGGQVQLQPQNVNGGTDNGFAITFPAVPANVCTQFVSAVASSFDNVQVNQADVMKGHKVVTAQAVRACNSMSPASVTLLRGVRQARMAIAPPPSPCSPKPSQNRSASCPGGQLSSTPPYSPNGVTETRTSYCPGATGSPQWGAWTVTASTCVNACVAPAPVQQTKYRWLTVNLGCPSGQSGTHSYQRRQQQVTTTTYSCTTPVGPLSSSTGSSAWTNTAATRNTINTCASYVIQYVQTYYQDGGAPNIVGNPVTICYDQGGRYVNCSSIPACTKSNLGYSYDYEVQDSANRNTLESGTYTCSKVKK